MRANNPKNTATGTNDWLLHDPFGIPVEVEGGMHHVELHGKVDYCNVYLLVEDLRMDEHGAWVEEVYTQKVRLNNATGGSTLGILVGEMPPGVEYVISVS